MIILIMISRINANHWNIWSDKDEEEEDIPMEKIMKKMDNQMIMTIVKNVIRDGYEDIKIFMMVHTMEIVAIIITFSIIQWIIIALIKGRQRNKESKKEKEGSAGIYVNIANANNTASKFTDNTCNSHTSTSAEIKSMLNKPENLKNKTNISAWLEKIETYLESVEQRHWYKITISFIDVHIMREIHMEKTSEEDKYQLLKKQLLKMEDKQVQKDKRVEKVDYKAIGERKQLESETIKEYGNNLIQMITTLFPEINIESIDNWLKTIFADGLYNKELSKRIRWKIIKQQRKQEKFNMQDAIEYASDKNEAYEENEVYEHESDTQSNKSTSKNVEANTNDNNILAIHTNHNNRPENKSQIQATTPITTQRYNNNALTATENSNFSNERYNNNNYYNGRSNHNNNYYNNRLNEYNRNAQRPNFRQRFDQDFPEGRPDRPIQTEKTPTTTSDQQQNKQ